MPEIARFYGIVMKLFFGDHPSPHLLAVYSKHVGLFNINTLEMIEGGLPARAKKLVLNEERCIEVNYTKSGLLKNSVDCPRWNSHVVSQGTVRRSS